MLQTVFRFVIPICGLTLLLTTGSVLAGKNSPQPDIEYWSQFGFDACAMPCFAGIIPGETPFTDTLDLVNRYIPTLNQQVLISSSQAIFIAEDENSGSNVTGIARYADGKVGEIRLTLARPLFSVLLRFGTPECALAYPQEDAEYLYLYWEEGALMHWAVVAAANGIRYDSPIFTIASSALEENPACSTNVGTAPWRGFAPVWVYSNR